MMDLGWGPGDTAPVIARAKEKLGVFPVSSTYTEDLAARLRGWQLLHNGDPEDIYLDEVLLSRLGL